MKYITGQDRNQIPLFASSIEEAIEKDNEVRIIDQFVASLPIESLGFKLQFVENGRPGYHPADLLKLYLYGYLNKTRSSRDLEKECSRNIEVMWLLKGLKPDHNTISNFRRDNPQAIKKVFRATVKLARHFNLIGGKLLAGDSTKLRAQNSKKNNFNQAKVERHLDYIDRKLEYFNRELEQNDGDPVKQPAIMQEISKQNQRRIKYKDIENQLAQTGDVQVSTSDPESRQLITRNNITEVAYNVQTVVDSDNCLVIDYKVTNQNDSKAMGNMVRRTKSILGKSGFAMLYDKGYHTGSELRIAQELGVETIVAIPDIPSSSHAPNPAYNVSEFSYDSLMNTYTCPQGHILSTNGHWYRKDYRKNTIKVMHYKTAACKNCLLINQCTKNTGGRGRVIERSEYAPYYETNRRNVETKEHVYKRRQAIVEHPYGIIKRQWGFYYISTKKGMKRAGADVGLIFTAFNLRRLINIIGFDNLKNWSESLIFRFWKFFRSFLHVTNAHIRLPKKVTFSQSATL